MCLSHNLRVCKNYGFFKTTLSQTNVVPTFNISAAPLASCSYGWRHNNIINSKVVGFSKCCTIFLCIVFVWSEDGCSRFLDNRKWFLLMLGSVVWPGLVVIYNLDRTTSPLKVVLEGQAILRRVFVLCLLSQRCVKSGSQVGPLCPP